MPQRWVLIGAMGSGKTTLGHRLAKAWSCHFLDVDEEIEKRVGQSIPELFASEGEAFFRAKETQVLRQLLLETAREEVVIACGGGIVTKPENISLLKGSADTTVIWLKTSPERIAKRLSQDHSRPLLESCEKDRLRRIRELTEMREAAYDFCASICFEEDSMEEENVTESFLRWAWEKRRSLHPDR